MRARFWRGRRPRKIMAVLLCGSLCLQVIPLPVMAGESQGEETQQLSLREGESMFLAAANPTQAIALDPTMIDVVVDPPHRVMVTAKRPGTTFFFVWDDTGRHFYEVHIEPAYLPEKAARPSVRPVEGYFSTAASPGGVWEISGDLIDVVRDWRVTGKVQRETEGWKAENLFLEGKTGNFHLAAGDLSVDLADLKPIYLELRGVAIEADYGTHHLAWRSGWAYDDSTLLMARVHLVEDQWRLRENLSLRGLLLYDEGDKGRVKLEGAGYYSLPGWRFQGSVGVTPVGEAVKLETVRLWEPWRFTGRVEHVTADYLPVTTLDEEYGTNQSLFTLGAERGFPWGSLRASGGVGQAEGLPFRLYQGGATWKISSLWECLVGIDHRVGSTTVNTIRGQLNHTTGNDKDYLRYFLQTTTGEPSSFNQEIVLGTSRGLTKYLRLLGEESMKLEHDGDGLTPAFKTSLALNLSGWRRLELTAKASLEHATGYLSGSLVANYSPNRETNLFLRADVSGSSATLQVGAGRNFRFWPEEIFRLNRAWVKGVVFNDTNRNGVKDKEEPGLRGVVLRLGSEYQVTTDEAGNFTFPEVVMEGPRKEMVLLDTTSLPEGIIFTTPPAQAVELKGMQTVQLAFGIAATSIVQGVVFNDLNADGLRQPNEPGIEGIVLRLADGRTVTTDKEGFYRTVDAAQGEGEIVLEPTSLPVNYAVVSPSTVRFRLKEGEMKEINFCLAALRAVKGRVFVDANRNGKFDPGEEVLAGVKVIAGGQTVKTDAQGSYLLRNLPPGRLTVGLDEKTLPPGMRPYEATKKGVEVLLPVGPVFLTEVDLAVERIQ